MKGIRITGQIPLDGEVRIQGSKNAALPVMAAALLNRGTTVLKACPRGTWSRDQMAGGFPGNFCLSDFRLSG